MEHTTQHSKEKEEKHQKALLREAERKEPFYIFLKI